MNFVKTLYSICKGPRVFPGLLEVHPLRALLHLILLAILCAFFIAACRFLPVESTAMRICAALDDAFGSVKIEAASIVPAKPRKEPLTVILTDRARLDFFPATASLDLSGLDQWKSLGGFIWTPNAILAWIRLGGGQYAALPMIPTANSDPGAMDAKKLEAFIKDFKGEMPHAILKDVSFKSIGLFSVAIVESLILAGAFVGILLFCSITIFFFAGVQSIFSPGATKKLPFSKVLVVSAYAAFPGIMIASLSPALDLPFISFQMLFFLAFFIYHMLAFNAVQRSLEPKRPQTPEKWDDDDDF